MVTLYLNKINHRIEKSELVGIDPGRKPDVISAASVRIDIKSAVAYVCVCVCASVRARLRASVSVLVSWRLDRAGSPQDSIPTLATSRAANMSSDLKTFAPDLWTNVKPPRHGSGPSVGGDGDLFRKPNAEI